MILLFETIPRAKPSRSTHVIKRREDWDFDRNTKRTFFLSADLHLPVKDERPFL
jgi:hypothetical protein